MRKFLKSKFALVMAFMLLVPFLWNHMETTAQGAATPSLTKTKLTFKEIGDTYDINVKNKVANSKYSWTSSNKKVAKVNSKGVVTSTGTGTATIKCKITYPSKSTKTLSCKVTVTIPATGIQISELPLVNNAYQLALGNTVDLNAVITPSNSSDVAYWYIDKDNVLSDPNCISLDGNNQGIVTGLKGGKAVVRVKAAASATAKSDIDDTIIIEVVAPTATVKSAEIVDSNKITVIFDSPVQQGTVVNADGTLSSNITISLIKVKDVLAKDPGVLKASLSTDMKTLTINSDKAFEGTYGINFSKNILTTSKVPIEEYYRQMTFTDTIAPYIVSETNDDSGMTAIITFNEAIDFTNFAVKGATVVGASTTVSNNTLTILSQTSNYIISQDKKSLSINMSNISVTDYGKMFNITLAGIKDLSGNAPISYTLNAYITTDTTPKPQAQLLNIIRSGYKTLTAVFDRAIKTGGYLQINGGPQITGVVNPANTKQVIFTISDVEATYTGGKDVSIGWWNSYNVISTDTTANKLHTRYVDFTVETTSPVLYNFEFDATTNILTLTYSEEVTLSSPSGNFTATLTTNTQDTIPGINIGYTTVAHSLGNHVIKLKLTIGGTKTGSFAFTIYQGFVSDNFRNYNVNRMITISNSSGSTELPGPYMITQSTADLSKISIMFANKLDPESATNINNYKIAGVTVLSAELVSNAADIGAQVMLTVKTIDATTERPVTISGVKGFSNSYSAISNYSVSVLLKENAGPVFIDPPVFDTNRRNLVTLNFNEAIQGNLTVTVKQIYNSVPTIITNTVAISGNSATINLNTVPINGSFLQITIESNNITDAAGNKAVFSTTVLGVMAY